MVKCARLLREREGGDSRSHAASLTIVHNIKNGRNEMGSIFRSDRRFATKNNDNRHIEVIVILLTAKMWWWSKKISQ